MVVNKSLTLKTEGNTDIRNITPEIVSAVEKSGIKNGIVSVFIPGSTGAVTTIEYESGVISDLRDVLNELIPSNRIYLHNQAWGDGNGHSHIRASLMGPSLTVPIIDGRAILGTWQQIVFVDFDNRPRVRQLIVQILGE